MNEIKYDKKRLNEVKTILVTQPKPKEDNTPFHRLAEKYNLKVCEYTNPSCLNFFNCFLIDIKDALLIILFWITSAVV